MSKHYNPESTEDFMNAKIIHGNPSGILNHNRTPHKWASSIYKIMEGYTWYPEECGLGQDKIPYNNFSKEQKYAYDMALAQLITNDSVQSNQLVESIGNHITSPVPGACVKRQAYEEDNHSRSYAVCADEVCLDSDRIYNLYKYEPVLARKNKAVARMYDSINAVEDKPTTQEMLIAFGANQILENLVFPGGFVTLWSLGLPGTCKMISFIERDEAGTHVPLFRNLFRTAVSENEITSETKDTLIAMISDMTVEEKIWTNHITNKLLGFSSSAIDMFIEFKANEVCETLNLDLLFEKTDGGPLMSIVERYSMLSNTKTKTNFFEAPVGDYTVNGLDDDY